MNFDDFQQAIALLALPEEQLQHILALAKDMTDNERYAMHLELQELSQEDSKNLAEEEEEEEEPLEEMETIVRSGEQAVKTAEKEVQAIEERKESDEAMESIEDQIQDL